MAAARKRSAPRASGPLRIGFAALALVTTTSLAHGAEKVFTYAMSGEPESLDSAKAASVRATYVTWLLCDALINISKDGQRLESGLAESWTLSKDGLQAVIKLRGGVLFHDGGPVDARAVKASLAISSMTSRYRTDSRSRSS
jgi:peptide/nickel transport system substrate-binding protein